MIDVKGIRTAPDLPDSTDPLGLRKPAEPETRVFSPWLVGLIALALYLRSFLWPTPDQTDAEQGPGGKQSDDDSSATRAKGSLYPIGQKSAEDDEQQTEKSAVEAFEAAGPTRLSVVFGSFESGVFAPVPTGEGVELPRITANAPLPPFRNPEASIAAPSQPASPAIIDKVPVAQGNSFPATPANDNSDSDTPVEGQDGIVIPVLSGDATEDGDGTPSPDGQVGSGVPVPDDNDDEQGDDTVNPVQDRNRAPRNNGPVYLGEVGSGATLAITLAHLLSQTNDPEDDQLGISEGATTSGLLSPTSAGWRYLADTDHLGEVRIDYTVSDGEHLVAQSAILSVVENQYSGTDTDDLIVGTQGRDAIRGLAGNDNLAGLGGRDVIHGDEGNDNIAGGAGNDSLFGGDGDDIIAAGSGDDWVSGGMGNDQLYGEDGDDVIYGEAGDDTAYGGNGSDMLFGGEGNDLLDGGDGDDILIGNAGNDSLFGGAGNDILSDGAGKDVLSGGAGNDIVLASNDGASDYFDGGDGQDKLDYSDATSGVVLDLTTGVADGPSIGTDSFENFEHYVGSTHSDTIVAGAGQASFEGNGGHNIYQFVQGDTVEPMPSIYHISDFTGDDMIRFSSASGGKQIQKAQKSIEDRIDDFFDDFADNSRVDEPRLRYSHEWTDEYRHTIVEVDFDGDRSVDLTLMIDGEHVFVVETV